MRYPFTGCIALLAILVCFTAPISAGVPHLVSIQGRAIDASLQPLDGTQSIKFKIYGSPSGTDSLWSSGAQSVEVDDGLFSYQLGSHVALPASLFSGSNTRWLGITIGADPELAPRTQLIAVPYAVHAEVADTASYALAAPTSTSPWIDDGTSIRLASIGDSVGIGVANPGVPLEVQGEVTAIQGHTNGTGLAAGVMGVNGSTGYGVMGMSTGGCGVFGMTSSGFGGYFSGPKHYFSGHLGIGTETPEQMLHVYENGASDDAYVQMETDNFSSFGETGIVFKNPTRTWRLFMDDSGDTELNEGGLGFWGDGDVNPALCFDESSRAGFNTTPYAGYQVAVEGVSGGLYATTSGGGPALSVWCLAGYGLYAYGAKHVLYGPTGFGTETPTHTITLNGSMGFQETGTTEFHVGCYNNGLNFVETSVADYRLFLRQGGNVGIGTSNPTTKLYVAGSFHADSFEADAIGRDNIRDEVGVASAPSGSIYTEPLSSTWASYIEREITVPTAGYVLAMGCACVYLDHDVSGSTEAEIAFSDSPTTAPSVTQWFKLSDGVNEGARSVTIPTQRIFYCATPGTYTYYMVARETGDNYCSIGREKMDLLFVPTVYSSKNGVLADAGNETAVPSRGESRATQQTGVLASTTSDVAALTELVTSLSSELQAVKERLAEMEKK